MPVLPALQGGAIVTVAWSSNADRILFSNPGKNTCCKSCADQRSPAPMPQQHPIILRLRQRAGIKPLNCDVRFHARPSNDILLAPNDMNQIPNDVQQRFVRFLNAGMLKLGTIKQ